MNLKDILCNATYINVVLIDKGPCELLMLSVCKEFGKEHDAITKLDDEQDVSCDGPSWILGLSGLGSG